LGGLNAGRGEVQRFRLWGPTGRLEHVRGDHIVLLARRSYGELDLSVRPRLCPSGLCVRQDLDAIFAKDLCDLIRDLRILLSQYSRAALNDADLAAEPTEHLAELNADIAAPNDDQVFG
jgi:hypothetical protein